MGNFISLDSKNYLNIRSAAFGVILGFCAGKALEFRYDSIFRRTLKNSKQAECLFFTPRTLVCTVKCNLTGNEQRDNLYAPCNNCSLKRLISILGKTKKSLDICMYLITSESIMNVIILLFKNDVSIRVILDNHMTENAYGADVIALRNEYVPIKVIRSDNIMHNKFAVIDEETIISGSLNWTRQGLLGNYENVIIMTDKNLAKKFTNYFQYLWEMNDE